MKVNNQLPVYIHNPVHKKNPELTMPNEPNLLKKRCYAFVTDLLLINVINKGLIITYISFIKSNFYQLTPRIQNLISNKIYDIDIISLIIVFWGYFLVSLYWGKGKTLGKIVFNLRVYSKNFKNVTKNDLSFRECFARTIGYFICCSTFGFLFIFSLFTKSRKGLPDWISGTSVITDSQMTYLKIVFLTPDFKKDFMNIQKKHNLIENSFQNINHIKSDSSVIELPAPIIDYKKEDDAA